LGSGSANEALAGGARAARSKGRHLPRPAGPAHADDASVPLGVANDPLDGCAADPWNL